MIRMVCIHTYYFYTETAPSLVLQAGFTPRTQLLNFISVFGTNDLVCFADNLEQDSLTWLYDKIPASQVEKTALDSSLKAFQYMLQLLGNNSTNAKDCIIYFIDGFVLHAPISPVCIREGIQLADYVTLIDSPDKYINSGKVLNQTVGGSLIWGNGEWTRLVFTAHSHWKFTYCANLSVAAKMSTLTSDASVFNGVNEFDRFPLLQNAWINLQKAGRTLISSVPGKATMSYASYISPVVDWSRIVAS